MCSCRGTPFTLRCSRVSQSKPTCGADNDIPLQCVDACVPTLVLVLAGTYAAARCSPLIRAGGSHLPCGTIGRARLAEKMGGTGSGMQTRIKRHRIGEVSSKYGYNPGQFDQDLEARKARSDALWEDFLGWMKLHGITPDEARGLFRRLFEEYLK